MGTWSGEPFGNDVAADFAWELDETRRWRLVRRTLRDGVRVDPSELDSDAAVTAIAAAEVVAHGLGRPTQTDVYTESVRSFVARARTPSSRLARLALRALDRASAARGELALMWAEGDASEWDAANDRLRTALIGGDDTERSR